MFFYNKSLLWKCNGCPCRPSLRKLYSDGTSRPLLRGFLHALVSFILICCLISLLTFDVLLSSQQSAYTLFILAKLSSYMSSALYHLCQTSSDAHELALLKCDTLFITVAMWAPTNLFAVSVFEFHTLFIFMALATALNMYTIQRQYAENASPLHRFLVLIAFGSSQMTYIGWHVNFSITWWLGTLALSSIDVGANNGAV